MDEILSRDVEMRLRNKLGEENFEIVKFRLLTEFLSPVRNQGRVRCCTHVCIVASVEMIYRICGILIDGSKLYYFDVNELLDHAYFPSSREDVLCTRGTDIHTVMSFAINNGLKSIPTCTDPRPRDPAAQFDSRVKRYRVKRFVELPPKEVIFVARVFPIVAGLIPYWSFRTIGQLIYHGPTEQEVEKKNSIKFLHTVLIVGFTKIRRGNKVEKFVIIQNSWSSTYGLSGFAIVPFDCENLFLQFFAPDRPIPDHDPQGIASSSASSNPSQKSFGSSVDVDGDFEIPSDDVENFVEAISEKGDHSSSTRSKRKRKAAKSLQEDFFDQLDEDPLDLLDRQKTRSALRSSKVVEKKSESDDEPEIDSEGRLIIHENGKKEKGNREQKRGLSSDIEVDDRSEAGSLLSASSRKAQKLRKTLDSGWSYTE